MIKAQPKNVGARVEATLLVVASVVPPVASGAAFPVLPSAPLLPVVLASSEAIVVSCDCKDGTRGTVSVIVSTVFPSKEEELPVVPVSELGGPITNFTASTSLAVAGLWMVLSLPARKMGPRIGPVLHVMICPPWLMKGAATLTITSRLPHLMMAMPTGMPTPGHHTHTINISNMVECQRKASSPYYTLRISGCSLLTKTHALTRTQTHTKRDGQSGLRHKHTARATQQRVMPKKTHMNAWLSQVISYKSYFLTKSPFPVPATKA